MLFILCGLVKNKIRLVPLPANRGILPTMTPHHPSQMLSDDRERLIPVPHGHQGLNAETEKGGGG